MVARFDLMDALRSRRSMVLLGVYLLGSMGAAGLFVNVLAAIERNMAQQLKVAATERPGAMTEQLMDNEQLRSVIGELVGDPALAEQLLTIPPLALFYGWVVFAAIPLFTILSSADAVSGELSSGSCRYAMFRTDRSTWALGKLLGQSALVAAGVALGALGTLVVGQVGLARFDLLEHALWLGRMGARGWLVGLTWVGVALGASQLTRSPHIARGLALLALLISAVGRGLLEWPELHDQAPVLCDTLLQLFPGTHRFDLWRPDWQDRVGPSLMLVALGLSAFWLGHQRLLRRDM